MKRSIASVYLVGGFLLSLVASACDDPRLQSVSPTAPSVTTLSTASPSSLTQSFVAASKSGCHTVAGTMSETGAFPNFSGTIAGDLVGTTNSTLSFDARFTGGVIHNPAARTLGITGGTIPELIGVSLHETLETLSISEAHPVIRLSGQVSVDAGAQRGYLTEHGTLDLATGEVELEYQGVICP